MRILYLCHRVPYPPNKGEKIRAFHQIRAIARRHEVDLFTLADDPADLAHAAAMSEYCREVTAIPLNPKLARVRALPFLLTPKPITLPYFYSRRLDRAIRNALARRSYDRIFVYCSAMAQYVESIENIPVIMDMVDVDSDKWLQYAEVSGGVKAAIYRREGRSYREYESRISAKFPSVLVTTEREAELIQNFCPEANVHVITNGVDTDYFNPQSKIRESIAPAIVFTGDMGYFPNEAAVIYFARNVLPSIQGVCPDVRFLIVGRNPTRNVRELQNIAGVEVTGFVPDVRTYLAQAQVSVAPFSMAMGIQNKILEAMAFGLPVVATSRAVQGLSSKVRTAIDVADAAGDMAATVVRLLRDPEEAHRKGLAGRRVVSTEYTWNRSLDQVMNLLEYPEQTSVAITAAGAHR